MSDADGSIDMDKFLLHSEEVASQRKWSAAAVFDLLNINNAAVSGPPLSLVQPHEKKKCSLIRVWAHKASEDGPLKLIPHLPEKVQH